MGVCDVTGRQIGRVCVMAPSLVLLLGRAVISAELLWFPLALLWD